MIKKLIAYSIEEVEKLKILDYANDLNKSQIVSQNQLEIIRSQIKSNLYSPSIFMRILLFVLSLIGFATVIGPIALILQIDSEVGIRFTALFTGVAILLLLDLILIKKNKHYKSGVTEAALLVGLLLLSIGLLGFDQFSIFNYLLLGFVFTLFVAIRYLNTTGLIAALGFLGALIFNILIGLGGIAEALLPFALMMLYGVIFLGVNKLQKQTERFLFDDFFTLAKVFCLLLFYFAGNYFVVRELSVEIMGNYLEPETNIPFAYLFLC